MIWAKGIGINTGIDFFVVSYFHAPQLPRWKYHTISSSSHFFLSLFFASYDGYEFPSTVFPLAPRDRSILWNGTFIEASLFALHCFVCFLFGFQLFYQGTTLAAANNLNMRAMGVELSSKRCRTALVMDLEG